MDYRLDSLKIKYLGINFQDVSVNHVTNVRKFIQILLECGV